MISPIRSRSSAAKSVRHRCWNGCEPMSAEKVTYLDSSAIVKLVVREPESTALRAHLRRRRPLVSSALARTEVVRALLPLGDQAVRRGHDVLGRIELIRMNDRVLRTAGELQPPELLSLDAIHLASAQQFDTELRHVVTYDERMIAAARQLRMKTASPR
jgi:predicted nucleic acid-binding protein